MKDKENKKNVISKKNIKEIKPETKSKVKINMKKKEKISLKDESDEKKLNRVNNLKIQRKNENDAINKSVSFNLLEVVIIILITGIVVSISSGLIVYNNLEKEKEPNFSITESDLKEFEKSYNNIINNYIEEVDKTKLLDAAISGMYNYLNDEYSVYVSKEENETLQEQLEGEYTGIGIEVTTYYNGENNAQTIITRVFSNTPAEKAGLLPGDIIKKLDGKDVIDSSDLSNSIKKGTKDSYELTYIRNEKEYKATIERDHVIIDSVTTENYDTVGYIKLDTFSATTKNQVKNALDSFDSKIKSLVIDLRDNTGGYLNSAYEIADLFVEKGKVIYQLKDRNGKIEEFKAQNKVYKKFDKIVVLINQNSASASEVLALALRESSNSKIVGVKSYGKGTVQEAETLSSGAMIKYTSSYWLSPNGNSINKVGITPDVVEENVNEQLNKAIETAK